MKLTLIGAGGFRTPVIYRALAAGEVETRYDDVAFYDIDQTRLDRIGCVLHGIDDELGTRPSVTMTTDLEAAVDGADIVYCAVRAGGMAGRILDETAALAQGVIGQETTGAGGFAKALRTVPRVLEIAEEVSRRAASDAWIIDFTNPVGIVTQALIDDGHRALGLCNVAITLQRRLATRFGVEPERVQLEHVGLNHLSWERAVRVDGEDRLQDLLDEDASELADELRFPVEMLRWMRAIPSYYIRYYYLTRTVLGEQMDGHTRARDVMDIEARLLEMYRDPSLTEKPELLDHRGGAFYSEAAAQLIASLHDGRGDVQVVDVRNGGALADLPDDAVVEIPAVIDRDGAHPLPLAPLEPEQRALVQAVKAYEELTIEAARTGNRDVALRALAANPLVGAEVASPLLDAILEADAAHLELFATV